MSGHHTLSRPATLAKGRWIDDWTPEDRNFWDSGGSTIARRKPIFSIFPEHIGFAVWTLWSVLVLFLGPAYGVDPAGKSILTAFLIRPGATSTTAHKVVSRPRSRSGRGPPVPAGSKTAGPRPRSCKAGQAWCHRK
jgi:hypothetical protein